MSGETLKPCPFCGAEAHGDATIRYSERHQAWWADGTQVRDAFYVNCMKCGIDNKGLMGFQTKAEALAAWNTRPLPTQDQRETVARIVDPLAWQLHEEVMRTAGLDPADRPPAGLVSDAARLATQRTEASLAKADAIIALMYREGGRG